MPVDPHVSVPVPPQRHDTLQPQSLSEATRTPSEESVPTVTKTATTRPSAGRGGTQHQYFQRLIKQWAEGMGYKATIEGPVLGVRAADVALEKEGLSIACELCITTGFVHELGNIRKCLDAGFTHVVAICPEPARLANLRSVVEQQLEGTELERVRFYTPDQFFAFVQELEVSSVIAESMRRLKRK
jgi:hypothetical protein